MGSVGHILWPFDVRRIYYVGALVTVAENFSRENTIYIVSRASIHADSMGGQQVQADYAVLVH
jgi:hypothetical protein